MNSEEIKDYLKRTDELELKLTGEDKDTYQWLLFGYNECARLLNEKEHSLKELRSWLGEWLKITEKQYDELNEPVRKSFFKVTIDTLKEVLLKLNELEKKSAESGKNIQ